jgi:NADPH:quinone reductase
MDERRFDFDTALDAHRELEAGRANGKLVIDIRGA